MENPQENKNCIPASIDDSGFDLFKLLEELENGSYEYEMAIKELNSINPDFEISMVHMIKSAKKSNQDALNWLVNAGIRIIIPDILWEKHNIQACFSYVLMFCKEHETGDHAAMARFFLGLLCWSGKGLAKNENLAISYFKKTTEGPFFDAYGLDADEDEHVGAQLVQMYFDVFSEVKKMDSHDMEGPVEYWNFKEMGEVLFNGNLAPIPFFKFDKYFVISLRFNVLLRAGEYLLAEEYIYGLLKEVGGHERILFESFRSILFQQVELKKTNQALKDKESELEETIAMFAHKFRSPLDAIIYNTSHEQQPKLYIQAAQTMRGLLDIFSIISTDADSLQERLTQDNQGNGNLMNVLAKTLDMILLHLLSVSASEKIQQHYLRYAKAHKLCPTDVSDKQWNEDYFELEQQLQVEWEQSFAQLLNESPTMQQRLDWLALRFFKLEVQGFASSTIQFRDYGITESFLTILLNEILVNAFKYYSSVSQQPVYLSWSEPEGYQVLSCRNPSISNERSKLKGSGKGHTFLSALARKTGSQFTKPKAKDDFVLEFGIANQLLSNS